MRDGNKKYTDPSFDWDMDIDDEDFKKLMMKSGDLTHAEDYRWGMYCMAMTRLILLNKHFMHYPDEVKEDLTGAMLVDILRLRGKFDGTKYPAKAAAFSYAYRVGYCACSRWLKAYYKKKNEEGKRVLLFSELEDWEIDEAIENASKCRW